MLKLGFDSRWVQLIMSCVSSVQYRVNFNGVLTEVIKPSRGLRQGDPLSPYPFLLVAEGLSSMLQGAENRGDLVGIRVCREAPMISHLLFADDSLILMQADRNNADHLKAILDTYCQNSGQKISEAKSSIFFSGNTAVEDKAVVCGSLDIMTEALNDKYLGLPAMIGVDKSDCFRHLIDRVNNRINGWKEKMLSTGGKEVLIKSIAQAIPVFAMSFFRIPKKMCDCISEAIARFWWGDDENHRRIHWKAWWRMCIPKQRGGLGYRDLYCFNQAMLAKHIWRFLCDPDSLCARVMRCKYYPDGNILRARPKKGSSYT